ncbi:adenine-specific DNA-methyltransferase [Microbacterium resistens]|uniref:Adenine-specific DNA-methyltransferase n=1 Tax=Microbacterium resistens TaxID=156977 RepID=A0ABU1SG66_9MICO|nr:hypothetical protein [Microbacterium resistens]MDR6868586.1 adenine-specific DNA-methyltransferase [Microbacterium resistens]
MTISVVHGDLLAAPSTADTPQLRAVAGLAPWWRSRLAQAGLSAAAADLSTALASVPPAPLPQLDTDVPSVDPWSLGTEYVETLDPASRAQFGRHYTPRDLAEQLWTMTRKAMGFGIDPHRLPGLLRDPAVGSGALLIAPLREHLLASADDDPALVLNSLPNLIEGIDNDPWAAYIANVVLAAEMLPTWARIPEHRRRPLPALVRVGDGIAADLPPAHSWIMNPPYGRQRLSDKQRAQFADTLYGHANLYGLFIASTIGKTAKDGAVGALVPTSFTAGLYFFRLREQLATRMPMKALSFVHSRDGVFGGVLQETCLAVFSPRRSQRTAVTRINGHVSDVAKVPIPRGNGPWLIPRESRDAATAAKSASLPLRLGDLGWRASTGPLVWNRRVADLHARPGKNRARIVWAADMIAGRVARARTRDSMRYLALNVASDPKVMTLTEPAVLVQRTSAPEQDRRLIVADLDAVTLQLNGGSVVIENHINVLRPTTEHPLIDHATLAHVLASAPLDRIIRCISGSVAVSAYELDALPFPDAETVRAWANLDRAELDTAIEEAYR